MELTVRLPRIDNNVLTVAATFVFGLLEFRKIDPHLRQLRACQIVPERVRNNKIAVR